MARYGRTRKNSQPLAQGNIKAIIQKRAQKLQHAQQIKDFGAPPRGSSPYGANASTSVSKSQAPSFQRKYEGSDRKDLVKSLIKRAGGNADFQKKAFGPDYKQGALSKALKTTRSLADTEVNGVSALSTGRGKAALDQRNTLLKQRRKTLKRIYNKGGGVPNRRQRTPGRPV